MTGGIAPHERAIIGTILSTYADDIQSAALFGSRATGMARHNSDIDLVLHGTLDEAQVDRLWTLFDESALSVSVDIVAYDPALYPPLRRNIDRTSRPILTQSDLQGAEFRAQIATGRVT